MIQNWMSPESALVILTAIVCLTGFVYVVQLVRFRIGLTRLQPGSSDRKPSVAVIIAARNEEDEIGACLECLCAQDYPHDLFTVYVVDDGSTDATADIVAEAAERDARIRLLTITETPPGIAPKKHAVSTGIAESDSEIIILTDADSRAGPSWIGSMVNYFTPEVGMVLGFTGYRKTDRINRLFLGMQTMDFFSLNFVSAGAVGAGQAFTSNANNLAIRREVYGEVDGYGSLGRYISGDDDLLLQRVADETRWGVRFAIEQSSYVITRPAAGVGEFFRQRMRWASKSATYNKPVLLFMVSTFIFFTALPILLVCSLLGPPSIFLPLSIRSVKFLSDLMVMRKGYRLFDQQWHWGHFLLTELLHIPYIVTIAIGSRVITHEWRGRRSGSKVA